MKALKINSVLFAAGSGIYSLIEILWRGYTHWTMGVTGGLCLVLIHRADLMTAGQRLWKKCLIGSGIITSLEFVVGCIVNLWLKWNVWDYSGAPMNILGQICLPFSIAWFLLSVPAIFLGRYFRKKLSLRGKSHAQPAKS